jgi:hypothetical protein
MCLYEEMLVRNLYSEMRAYPPTVIREIGLGLWRQVLDERVRKHHVE